MLKNAILIAEMIQIVTIQNDGTLMVAMIIISMMIVLGIAVTMTAKLYV